MDLNVVSVAVTPRDGGENAQAMNVDAAPAAAPEMPKQVTVPKVGMLPGLLTASRGSSSPVTLPIRADVGYLTL